jgi:starch phosphorylase
MASKTMQETEISRAPQNVSKLLDQYGCGPVRFTGTDNALYERHLLFDNAIDPSAATPRDRFEAFARSVRDILTQRWVLTEKTYQSQTPKRLYYLSMEFLIGRSLANNVANLRLGPLVKEAMLGKSIDWIELLEQVRCRSGKRGGGTPGGLLH